MNHVDLEQRLAELARRLDVLEAGSAAPADALEAVVTMGHLLRRQSLLRDQGLSPAFVALQARAGRRLSPERLRPALAALGLGLAELADAQRHDPEDLDAERALAAALLEGRERAEASRWALRELGAETTLRESWDELGRSLAGLDRLGQARLQRLLLLNQERQRGAAGLDAKAAADWWWSLRASCRPDALASAGALVDSESAWLEAHLASCRPCRDEAAWLARMEQLLGGTPEGHPSSARLTALAAGELSAAEREAVMTHLRSCASCRDLASAARSGLDEADRVEEGLSLLAARQAGRAQVSPAAPLHLPLAIARPAAARALAATEGPEAAPDPADRRVLLEEPGRYRLVYFREGAAGRVGLFASPPSELELELLLDGQPLPPMLDEPGVLLFALGPTADLAGRSLRLRLRQRSGTPLADRSFTLVEEAP